MTEELKKDIDNIVWWIPFRKLRCSIRNLSNSLIEDEDKNPIFKPLMTDNERKLFLDTVKKSKYYLEFGSGGSTFLVLKTTDAKVFSVEGDNNWIEHMRSNDYIYEQELIFRLYFYYVNIGKIKIASYPIDSSRYNEYPNYSSKVFLELDREYINNIDTVFIDGRFRVACVLNSILNINRNATIIIHDFFNREYYHVLLKYLDCVNQVDTLGIFKIKNDINDDDIIELIKEYQYDLR